MNWHTVSEVVFAHPVLCIVIPAMVAMQITLILIAFHTCSCEECGKPFGIWRCRDRALELCYRCYRARLPERRKARAALKVRQPASIEGAGEMAR